MNKIKLLEEATVDLPTASIHIAESSDGIYNITFNGTVRVCINEDGNKHFMFIDSIEKTILEQKKKEREGR